MNYSEFIIAPLIGRAKKGVTSRYANAPDSALVAAAGCISLILSDALNGLKGAKIISIGSGRN